MATVRSVVGLAAGRGGLGWFSYVEPRNLASERVLVGHDLAGWQK